MKKAFVCRYHISLMLAVLALLSAIFGRGLHLVLFFLPIFMSYMFHRKGRVLLKKKEGNIIAGVMSIVFIPLFFSRDVFVMALYYLLGLLSLKLFVSFKGKDYDHVALLGFLVFSLSTVFLYSIWYIMLFIVFGILITLYLFLRIVPQEEVLPAESVKYISLFIPLMIVVSLSLFFMLPRNPYVLFGMNMGRSGDFGELEVGGFNRETLSSRVVLRVKPFKRQSKFIYLRSRVYTMFDGEKWVSEENWENRAKSRVIIGKNPGYKTREYRCFPVSGFTFVPLVEYPVLLLWEGGKFAYNRDLMQVKIEERPRKMDYTIFSISSPNVPLAVRDLPEYLEVPVPLKKYLSNILDRVEFSEDTLLSIVRFLKKNYTYGKFEPHTDTLPPIVEFLSQSRKGECSEFATAFVLLARMLGYKVRLVAGFLTQEFNTLGSYFIVREKHAHAWAEVFEKGRWIRYDPTPSTGQHESLMVKIREYYDYVQYLWFTRVVEYNYRDQMHIALKVMPYYWKLRKGHAGKSIAYIAAYLLLLFIVIYVLFSLILVPFHRRALRRFLRYMKKKGFVKNRGETLVEFAKRSKDKKALEFVKEYHEVKYGKKTPEKLKSILKSF